MERRFVIYLPSIGNGEQVTTQGPFAVLIHSANAWYFATSGFHDVFVILTCIRGTAKAVQENFN